MHSLSHDLRDLLLHHGEGDITVSRLVETLGERGFGLLIAILSLPSALPVPAPGYSTPFGILLLILGIQLVIGRRTPWLPAWALRLKIGRSLAETMVGAAARFFAMVERLIKPRLAWASGRVAQILGGVIIMIMAGLMILPIPLTNTAPAMVIFLMAIAMIEEDGLLMLLALLAGVAAIFFYAFLVYLFLVMGDAAIDMVKDWIKSFVGAEPISPVPADAPPPLPPSPSSAPSN